ncbi:MAG: FkbM family methyltransferase [Verrucomicrobiota bacterium JB022]|nr:FkbM family methyltransferase [Verrucomicrobiota bacterium JB022]
MFEQLPSTAADFYRVTLFNALVSLKINRHADNFDAFRFNVDGKDHALDFNVADHVFYFDWFFRTHPLLFATYQQLGDDASKRLFLFLVLYRLCGHLSVKIPLPWRDQTAELEAYRQAESPQPSTLALSGLFGGLKHYDFTYRGRHYRMDSMHLEPVIFRRQYFYEDNGLRIAPEAGDHVIDGGACTGDTAVIFSDIVGPEGRVYAFDPVADHLDVIQHNLTQNGFQNVSLLPYGISETDVDAEPMRLNRYWAGFNVQDQPVPLRTIDRLVAEGQIERVDFIKFDIEGSELAGLKGARQTIERFKPKLAISLYHKPQDLYEIPQYLRDNFPFYEFRLGHYTIHREETILYAIARA